MSSRKTRQGDDLYPVAISQQFGDHLLALYVPEGVWNPTPHGIHPGNLLVQLGIAGRHVLEPGTGCGIHAILLARRLRRAGRRALRAFDRVRGRVAGLSALYGVLNRHSRSNDPPGWNKQSSGRVASGT